MAFKELFIVYPNKNAELAMLAKKAYEFGMNISQEPSAGMSIGLDEHARKRQRTCVEHLTAMVEAIHARPIPDLPYTHPVRFDCDFTEEYQSFTKDKLAINEDTELLAQYWMLTAVSLVKSQSAGLAGSLIDADYERVANLLATTTQFLDEMDARVIPDLPETAFPGAVLEVASETRTAVKK